MEWMNERWRWIFRAFRVHDMSHYLFPWRIGNNDDFCHYIRAGPFDSPKKKKKPIRRENYMNKPSSKAYREQLESKKPPSDYFLLLKE